MGLHIGAVFIILVTSGLAIMIPLLSSWLRKTEQINMDGFDSAANFGRKTGWWGNIFFIARHFGTGIIISTAFIVSPACPSYNSC
jgi:zinc transporter 1/2/3